MEPLPDDKTRLGIARAVSSATGERGKRRLILHCGTCHDAATIEKEKNRDFSDADYLERAATRFFKLGWRWTDRPICPECIWRGKLSSPGLSAMLSWSNQR
jgi:hypothetical protein